MGIDHARSRVRVYCLADDSTLAQCQTGVNPLVRDTADRSG